MDVHLAYFTAAFATWYKIITIDKDGKACTGDGILCPQPRRDASIKVMGNTGGNSGRSASFMSALAPGQLRHTARASDISRACCISLWHARVLAAPQ